MVTAAVAIASRPLVSMKRFPRSSLHIADAAASSEEIFVSEGRTNHFDDTVSTNSTSLITTDHVHQRVNNDVPVLLIFGVAAVSTEFVTTASSLATDLQQMNYIRLLEFGHSRVLTFDNITEIASCKPGSHHYGPYDLDSIDRFIADHPTLRIDHLYMDYKHLYVRQSLSCMPIVLSRLVESGMINQNTEIIGPNVESFQDSMNGRVFVEIGLKFRVDFLEKNDYPLFQRSLFAVEKTNEMMKKGESKCTKEEWTSFSFRRRIFGRVHPNNEIEHLLREEGGPFIQLTLVMSDEDTSHNQGNDSN